MFINYLNEGHLCSLETDKTQYCVIPNRVEQ